MDAETQTLDNGIEVIKDIYAKLDNIHAIIGFILEKNKMLGEINALQNTESSS